jgi:catechol 2,3-dioxygenase-like lactoylglutathione lyase family enzyme
MTNMNGKQFDVGGVLMNQPFKIRRLGHFGINVEDVESCVRFYHDLLGFRLSDIEDIALRPPGCPELRALGDTKLYFLRHGTDHHSFVICNRKIYEATAGGPALPSDVSVQQMTWQVGSLAEVSAAMDWLMENGAEIQRVGRDMPGSNWHVYPYDPERHRNELYYGMEQIGWSGVAKPTAMHARGFREQPELPQISEDEEVKQAISDGIDLSSGFRDAEALPARYDVDGILLPRPFKIVRHGPIRLFCHDVPAMENFYVNVLGFMETDEVIWRNQRCVFLRCNTEHHALALYPISLRDQLGLSAVTTVLSFGMQVANYRQLRDAVRFLKDNGCSFIELPNELSPGIDYCAYVFDPAGHAIQLYFGMEQIGWDGRPRTSKARPSVPFDKWPDFMEAISDTYTGEPYLGPWG